MVILDLFYLSSSYFGINYQEIKLVSPKKVCFAYEGTWGVISLSLSQPMNFYCIFSHLDEEERASWWAHGGKPWSIYNIMSSKTLPFGSQRPCFSGQQRNNLRDKLSFSADSLEKPGR